METKDIVMSRNDNRFTHYISLSMYVLRVLEVIDRKYSQFVKEGIKKYNWRSAVTNAFYDGDWNRVGGLFEVLLVLAQNRYNGDIMRLASSVLDYIDTGKPNKNAMQLIR